MTQLYDQIKRGEDVRKNLIELRKWIKEDLNKRAFYYELDGDYEQLYSLLKHEDAKVRKNVALIMAELGLPEFMMPLYKAYEAEEKLFVKSDYLDALMYFNYSELLPSLKERLHFLSTHSFEETSMKHIREEIAKLTALILKVEEPTKHDFNGYTELSDIILLTHRDYQEVTLGQIHKGQAKSFGAGVMVRTSDLKEILKIRTYTELLFKLKDVSVVPKESKEAARTLWEGGLLSFLEERHKGYPPYYFRIEMKTKMALDEKSSFTKSLAAELEALSKRQLINSTSHYEVEIRLIENKAGSFNVLIKLYTLPDKRFDYRKNTVAASLAPTTAALVMELAKEYMEEGVQVLDPFCGVGTMLIERHKVVPAGTMYGIDLYGDAIDGAIENTHLADTDVYLITRDFFDFTHKYLFDEIITNMPSVMGRKTTNEIEELYSRFFEKAKEHLTEGGRMMLYTREGDLVEQALSKHSCYKLLKHYELSKREKIGLWIIAFEG